MERGEELNIFAEALQNSVKPVKEQFSDDEKKRAAYALNLCMVSISQIIDYNDIYILEQEYEAILNNLNIEMFPKDEALLSILKQLLDTITFFRIQEGDKEMIEKEYQHKMKNAIWNAVPNFGLIVSGGNIVNMAISLASQVGIGYMNYRRTKSENTLEHEKQQWELTKSAINQFNGLRRELFDTAWRLADKYEFPDHYRLTERQIKQYNDILMDCDLIRRYERLTTIKDTFSAYPPFWYNYGNTANSISRDTSLKISKDTRSYYSREAVHHFESYWENNKYALLREDHMSSACALEEVDLLDVNINRDRIEELIDKAIRFSGNANDILQLCSISYLRIGQNDKASEILRILVNEDYNKIVNAQILSGLYVNQELMNHSPEIRSKYEILTTRVNPMYLYKMPLLEKQESNEQLQKEFNETQRKILISKFNTVIDCFMNNTNIELARLIPAVDRNENYPDYYYSEESYDLRKKDIYELFDSNHKKNDKKLFIKALYESEYIENYFRFLNRFFNNIVELNCLKDRRKLQDCISDSISKNSQTINKILDSIEAESISKDDALWLLDFSSLNFFDGFIEELKNQIEQSVLDMNDMAKYSEADSSLMEFCLKHDIPEPDILINNGVDAISEDGIINKYFDLKLLITSQDDLIKEQQRYKSVEEILKKYCDKIMALSDYSDLYFHDSKEFNEYIENSKIKGHKYMLQKAVAIYNDKSIEDVDILFTVDSIVPIIKNIPKKPAKYTSLVDEKNKKSAELKKKNALGVALLGGLVFPPQLGAAAVATAVTFSSYFNNKKIENMLKDLRPMFEEICEIE